MACNRFCKSTLDVYTNTPVTVSANNPITFTGTYKKTGSSVSFTNGSTTINLTNKGLYYISYSVTGTATGSTATPITISIYRNGVAVPSSTASETSTSTTSYVNISNGAIIEVDEVCPYAGVGTTAIPVTLVTSGNAVISNASVKVIKLA